MKPCLGPKMKALFSEWEVNLERLWTTGLYVSIQGSTSGRAIHRTQRQPEKGAGGDRTPDCVLPGQPCTFVGWGGETENLFLNCAGAVSLGEGRPSPWLWGPTEFIRTRVREAPASSWRHGEPVFSWKSPSRQVSLLFTFWRFWESAPDCQKQ